MRSKKPVQRDAQTNRKESQVTNTTGSRRSRLGLVALLAAIGSVAAIAAFPSGASASLVTCHGKTVRPPADEQVVDNQLNYEFTCNDKIVAYSIIVNRSVNYFDPEVEVFYGRPSKDQISPTESFGCEGPIPGNGFGCKGSAGTPDDLGARWIEGGLGTDQKACARHAKGNGFKTWLVVTTQETNPVTQAPFLISSEPFRLYGPGCSKAGGARAHHHLRA